MRIPRLHLLELEDLSGLPNSCRSFVTDALRLIAEKLQVYAAVAPLMEELLSTSQTSRVLDLCSGSGGPALQLLEKLNTQTPVDLLLSDLAPPEDLLLSPPTSYYPQALDVRELTQHLSTNELLQDRIWSCFNALHHQTQPTLTEIFHAAAQHSCGFIGVEVTQRSLWLMLRMFPLTLLVWLTVPFIKPFRFSRVFWSYLLPLGIFVFFWDGVVSHLRSYRPEELLALAKGGDAEGRFEWSSGLCGTWWAPLVYVVGRPRLRGY